MDAAELLDRTADLIEERGHAKETLQDREGRLCLVGAVHVALWGDICIGRLLDRASQQSLDLRAGALDALHRYLNLPHICELPAWNNAPAREAHEVIDACRHTAKVLRDG